MKHFPANGHAYTGSQYSHIHRVVSTRLPTRPAFPTCTTCSSLVPSLRLHSCVVEGGIQQFGVVTCARIPGQSPLPHPHVRGQLVRGGNRYFLPCNLAPRLPPSSPVPNWVAPLLPRLYLGCHVCMTLQLRSRPLAHRWPRVPDPWPLAHSMLAGLSVSPPLLVRLR